MGAGTTTTAKFNQARGALRFTTHLTMGDVYFSDSGNASAGANSGGNPSDGAATLAIAQALCTANNGDVVYVADGHAESVIAAAGMTFSTSGVSYIGLGNGRKRPVITFSTSTAAQMIVSGAQILFQNIVFDFTGIDAIVAAISVTGADVAFDNCEFICNSATAGVVKGLLSAATADRWKITNSRFIGTAANSGTTTTCQIGHESGVDYDFSNNFHCGKMTQAILNTATVLRGRISGNQIVVGTGTSAITMAAASTPAIAGNRMNVASGTTPITAAAGLILGGNTYAAAAGVTAGSAITF